MKIHFDDLKEAISLTDTLNDKERLFLLANLEKVYDAFKTKFKKEELTIEI